MYSGLLHCCCCFCRIYTRHRRRLNRQRRLGKIRNPHGIDYTGAASVDPCWPEAQRRTAKKLSEDIEDNYDKKRNDYDDDDDDDEQNDMWSRVESRVPFGAVILIIIGYVCLGAFMFHKFEGWTMIQSVYFSYITLATIGFGDFVCYISK